MGHSSSTKKHFPSCWRLSFESSSIRICTRRRTHQIERKRHSCRSNSSRFHSKRINTCWLLSSRCLGSIRGQWSQTQRRQACTGPTIPYRKSPIPAFSWRRTGGTCTPRWSTHWWKAYHTSWWAATSHWAQLKEKSRSCEHSAMSSEGKPQWRLSISRSSPGIAPR